MNELFSDPATLADTYVVPWGINIITALLVFVFGRWLAKLLVGAMRRVMERAHVDAMLTTFLGNILYAVLLSVVVITSLGQLGVETTSLLALLATAGLAVSLALKDQLSNFSAGVMLFIIKPFKTGDFIEVAGVSGVVEEIRIFNTLLRTGDNRELTVPNSQILDDTITNVSARDTRRIDMVIGIGYDDNIQQARELLMKIMEEEPRVLSEPSPVVMVAELAESSVDLAVRPWVTSGDYWAVRSDLLQTIKTRFDEIGISIPFPQRDFHIFNKT